MLSILLLIDLIEPQLLSILLRSEPIASEEAKAKAQQNNNNNNDNNELSNIHPEQVTGLISEHFWTRRGFFRAERP